MRTALNSALKEIREISAGLRLPEMESLDLGSVLKKAVQEHRDKTGDNVRLSLSGQLPEVALPVKIALYRVTQEALNNAHQHAGVNEADVAVGFADSAISLEVRDRGPGIREPAQADAGEPPGGHLGIRGMRERIEMLGGTLEVTFAPGEGTAVVATLALGESGYERE